MQVKEIYTQEEFDALPSSFSDYTIIKIKGNAKIIVNKALCNASVEAWGDSSVRAYDNASVEARGDSSVRAYDNSSVEARGNSSVEAWGNAIIRIYNQIKKIALHQYAVCVLVGVEMKAKYKSTTATLIKNPIATYSKEDFLGIYRDNVRSDGSVELFKSVQEDGTDFYSGEIKYEGTVKPKKWDPDPERQCGDGLHLSPTPGLALSYNKGKIKKCLVKIYDFVVYPKDITKVRCRKVRVVGDA